MVENPDKAGFREKEHTADWALEVWAPDLEGLFVQAAQGMMALAGVRLDSSQPAQETLEMAGRDYEELLVLFLGELLYLAESKGVGFNQIELKFAALGLAARLRGGRIASQEKEIKAVTFHNLEIIEEGSTFRTTIIFDV